MYYEEMETFSGYADDMAISWLCCVLGSGKTGTPVRILAVCPVDGGGLYYEYCKRLQLPGRGSGIQAFLLEYADKVAAMVVPALIFVSPFLAVMLSVISWLLLLTSSAYGLNAIVRGKKEGKLSVGEAVCHAVLHLFFVTDVISAVLVFRKIRRREKAGRAEK